MRPFSKLFLSTVLATIPLACNSGGDSGGSGGSGGGSTANLKASDLVGNWEVQLRRSAATCAGPVIGEQVTFNLAIAVNGARVTLSQAGRPDAVLDLRGSRVQGTTVETIGAIRETATIDFGIVGGRIVGTEVVVEVLIATNQENCRETLILTGSRQVGPPAPTPSAARFNGNWNLTGQITGVTGSACDPGILVGNNDSAEVTIVVTGSSATLTATGLPTVPMTVENGRLRSTEIDTNGSVSTTKVVDLGLVNDNMFNGTATFTTRDGSTVVCTVTQALMATRQ